MSKPEPPLSELSVVHEPTGKPRFDLAPDSIKDPVALVTAVSRCLVAAGYTEAQLRAVTEGMAAETTQASAIQYLLSQVEVWTLGIPASGVVRVTEEPLRKPKTPRTRKGCEHTL